MIKIQKKIIIKKLMKLNRVLFKIKKYIKKIQQYAK